MAKELNQRSIAMAAAVATDWAPAYSISIPQFRNTDVVKVDGKKIDLAPLSASLSKPGYLVGAKTCEFTPGLNLQGIEGYYATVARDWRLDSIFRACGWIRSSASNTITLKLPVLGNIMRKIAASYEAARIILAEIAEDGQAVLWDVANCIGNLEISGTAGAEIQMTPTLKGTYAAPSTGAAPTPNTGTNVCEYMQNSSATITITSGSTITDVIAKSFKMNAGFEINDWTDFGSPEGISGQRRSDRKPTHELVVGMDYSKYVELLLCWSGGYAKRMKVNFTHGTIAGRFCKFTLWGQLTNMPRGGEINLRTLTLSFDGVPSVAGNVDDEYQIDLY